MRVKKTERGWAGHFCCADSCLFRRNTLIEYETRKVVVSTVGNYFRKIDGIEVIEPTGLDCYYETMVFWSNMNDTEFYDIDVSREIYVDSKCKIFEKYKDNEANEMHDNVVAEVSKKIKVGLL